VRGNAPLPYYASVIRRDSKFRAKRRQKQSHPPIITSSVRCVVRPSRVETIISPFLCILRIEYHPGQIRNDRFQRLSRTHWRGRRFFDFLGYDRHQAPNPPLRLSNSLQMKGRKLARWMGALLAAALLLSILGYKIYYGEMFGYERESYISPDGRYRIMVLARGVNLSISMPGDAGGSRQTSLSSITRQEDESRENQWPWLTWLIEMLSSGPPPMWL